jgi:hypothetical protein
MGVRHIFAVGMHAGGMHPLASSPRSVQYSDYDCCSDNSLTRCT